MKDKKVFLGGTCNESTWRDELIPHLDVDYFNPVVEDWTPECQEVERQEKAKSAVHLYVITSAMTGVFSIAEAVESAMTDGVRTVFAVVPDGFDKAQCKSLEAVCGIINRNKGAALWGLSMREVAECIEDALFASAA